MAVSSPCSTCEGRPARRSARRSTSPIFPRRRRAMVRAPTISSLVEGSITTAHEAELHQDVRRNSQAAHHHRRLRQRRRHPGAAQLADVGNSPTWSMPHRPTSDSLADLHAPSPIARGGGFPCRAARCSKEQLLEVLTSLLMGFTPNSPHSVCVECKLAATSA
jgi:sulfhydrogenase subunit delta